MLLALTMLIAVGALGSSAGAAPKNNIEGVWSFNGGNVGIQRLANGTYQGTVVTPTKISNCTHPVGQVMWTDMRQQADGSFWGHHLWYRGASCETVAQPGETAWRVLENASGAHYLEVCLSVPGSGSQPTIAANGTAAHDTYGCVKSALVAPLPTLSGSSKGSGDISAAKVITLPSTKGCVRKKTLTIKLHEPRYDPFKEVVVRINGKKVADVHFAKASKKTSERTIVIKHLPAGTYKLSVLVVTVLKQRLVSRGTYHNCKGSGKQQHHGHKKKHHKGKK